LFFGARRVARDAVTGANMHIQIDWQQPVQLTRHKKLLIDENNLPEKIKDRPGVYFFSRRFGKKFSPFYIGETLRIRGRLKSHLNSKNIAFVLLDIDPKSEIKGGVRYFHYGYFKTTSEAKAKTCIKIVQRYLIREAISREIKLVNKNLTTVQTHALTFFGSKRSRAIYGKRANIER
jgi:hypothetical protein